MLLELDRLIREVVRMIDQARTVAVYCYRCKRLVPVDHPCEVRAFTNLELWVLKIRARIVRP